MAKRLDDLQYNGLMIYQDSDSYCFTSDAVHLANFVKAPKNAKVVDLCSGSGVIGMLVFAKNNIDSVKLVEIQSRLAQLSQDSVNYNNLKKNIEIINKPLQNICEEIGKEKYEVVVCNPPYKEAGENLKNIKEDIAIARHELKVTLEEIVCEASRLLKFGGKFYTILKEERLCDLIALSRKYNLEPKELRIITSAKGANVVMMQASKGGKSGLKISMISGDKDYK